MIVDLLTEKQPSKYRLIERYVRFILSRSGKYIKHNTHQHHILPKAVDMFPEYAELKSFSWNSVHLTHREHFIAHWMLHRIFPGTSQTLAFFNMCNALGRKTSKSYGEALNKQKERCREICKDPERNKKISLALKGKPKSVEHKNKLLGHRVSEETRQKLREKNIGKKHSEQTRLTMSKNRTGKEKSKNTLQSKINIARSLTSFRLYTPMGVFESYLEVALAYNCPVRTITLLFNDLSKHPRAVVRSRLNISEKGRSYFELGFGKAEK